jgi:hypothetical protein
VTAASATRTARSRTAGARPGRWLAVWHRPARRTVGSGLAALALLLLAPGAHAAADDPHVTLLDGNAIVVDGVKRSQLVLGLPLSDRTIVETAEDTRLVRIEWPNGEVADLGPQTKVMLEPPGLTPRGKPGPRLYVLQGWVKQAGPEGKPANGLVTPRLQLLPFQGAVVVHSSEEESLVFVESGTATLVERAGAASEPLDARSGSLYARHGVAAGSLLPRAPSAQLQRVPRSFRDPLPLRYAQVPVSRDAPPALPAPTYADLQPWLTAETPVRNGFTRRFMPLLRDRTFRRELDEHLKDHEEWRPILHPPPPPPPPPPPSAPAAPAATAPPGSPPGTLPDGSRPYRGPR